MPFRSGPTIDFKRGITVQLLAFNQGMEVGFQNSAQWTFKWCECVKTFEKNHIKKMPLREKATFCGHSDNHLKRYNTHLANNHGDNNRILIWFIPFQQEHQPVFFIGLCCHAVSILHQKQSFMLLFVCKKLNFNECCFDHKAALGFVVEYLLRMFQMLISIPLSPFKYEAVVKLS